MADHALDNGPFLALMVCSYSDQYDDENYFSEVEPKLRRGLDYINRADNGLVYNDPANPQCLYGFTDIVKKTGNLLFSSLIYYDACMHMERLCKKLIVVMPRSTDDVQISLVRILAYFGMKVQGCFGPQIKVANKLISGGALLP